MKAKPRTRTRPAEADDLDAQIAKLDRPRVVYMRRERCPYCKGTSIAHQGGTRTHADGSITRHRKCRSCGWTYQLILE